MNNLINQYPEKAKELQKMYDTWILDVNSSSDKSFQNNFRTLTGIPAFMPMGGLGLSTVE